MKVKCQECGQIFEKSEGVFYKKKNYHKECYVIRKEKDELYETICRILKLKSPGPRIYAQIKNYLKQGFTYSGMNNALVYFFEVKYNSIEKANEGIGIIPYVYEEANYYFNRIDKKKQKIAESAKNFSNEKRTVIIKSQVHKPKIAVFNLEEE